MVLWRDMRNMREAFGPLARRINFIASSVVGACFMFIGFSASIMGSATYYARRGGLRGAGGSSTDAKIASNIERGFCPKNRSAAVVPSGRVRKKL
jgi:hypothetical protein